MPVITGLELSEKILKIRRDIPVILYTGYNGSIIADSAKSIGIRSIMVKPVNSSDLLIHVREILDNEKENHLKVVGY